MMHIEASTLERAGEAIRMCVEQEVKEIKERLVAEYRKELDALLVRVASRVVPAGEACVGTQLRVAIVLEDRR